MKRFLFSFTIIAALIMLMSTSGQAQDIPWYEGITINSFISTSYEYNFNKPNSGENTYRVFDKHHNAFVFDVFELIVQRAPEKKGEAGFRFDLITGTTIPRYTASTGLFGDENIDVKQAYVSYIVPLGNGLTVDAGKYLTHMGYELIEGYDGYNDNVSRSFLFGMAIPFTHTGIRAKYAFSDVVSAMLMLANGWDNAVDNNQNKTVGAQLGVAPLDGLDLFANYIYGTERNEDNSHYRSVLDFVGTYAINDMISVGANFDYGIDEEAAADNENATWMGVAGYLRFNLFDTFSVALRGEQFDDKDGVRTGTKQKLMEFTITPEFRPAENLVLRGDFRFDSSNEKVFEKEDSFDNENVENAKTQNTVSINLLYYF